jgi:hypothetical protein
MVTGSFASSVHGVPRATQDIDVVVEPTLDQLLALMKTLGEPIYDSDTPKNSIEAFTKDQFGAKDLIVQGPEFLAVPSIKKKWAPAN